MALEHYKFTTSTKQFVSCNVDEYHLKDQNGIFYAREHESEDWSRLEKIEKKVCLIEKCGVWLYFLNIPLLVIICGYYFNWKDMLGIVVGGSFYGFPLWWFGVLIGWYEALSDKEIKKIIEKNKIHFTSVVSSNSYKKRSSSSSYSGGNSSGGGGSFGGTSTYVPANDINKALKDFETNGKDTNTLINDVSDEEREKLFSKYFKDEDKGQYANDKFNRDIAWPARKQTLEKILNEAEYEDDETKDNLSEKINNLGEEISNEDFQATAKEIRTFQERKRAKDNHIKYEGRLSNKDIKAIKDVLGYVCMGCGLDPVKEYGSEMKGILEAHHKNPWAEIKENEVRTVKPDDFYILCPNCHRMIHRLSSPADLDGLKKILNQNKKSYWWD